MAEMRSAPDPNSATTKRPVTVVTGFLGSGKTTLLARMLKQPAWRNTAVIVNEFGSVGLDHHLLRRADEPTLLVGAGCACCKVRHDLEQMLLELLTMSERREITALDGVAIETSGLADPAPILFTLSTHPVLQHHFLVDLVVTTVDAVNGRLTLERQLESVKQVTAADMIVLTKTDMAPAAVAQDLTSLLRQLNPAARIVQTVSGTIASANRVASSAGEAASVRREREIDSDGRHIGDVSSTTITFAGHVDWAAFGVWLSMLLHSHGQEILRVKGLVDVGGPGPVVLNGVQHVVHAPEHLDRWPGDERRTHLTFIMRSMEPKVLLDSLSAFQGIIGAAAVPLNTGTQRHRGPQQY